MESRDLCLVIILEGEPERRVKENKFFDFVRDGTLIFEFSVLIYFTEIKLYSV